jgi:hypothetical protein
MNGTLRATVALLTCIAAASVGCNYERSSAPTAIKIGLADPTAVGLGIQVISPAERTTPIAADITWSFNAGPEGAISANPSTGLTIIVPAGALSTTETISVTALAGSHIAYRFEPHLNFATTVHLVQSLATVRAPWLNLAGGHFSGASPELENGVVRITEIVPAIISLLDGTVSVKVGHFSGWIVGSGNESSSNGGSSQ